jgi:hypothetical protein
MYIRRVYTQVLFSAITCWHELGGPDVPNCTSEMLASPRLHPSRYADSRVQFCCFCTLGAQTLGPESDPGLRLCESVCSAERTRPVTCSRLSEFCHSDYIRFLFAIRQAEKHGLLETHSEFLEAAFGALELDPYKYLALHTRFLRPPEVDLLQGDASKARRRLRLVAADQGQRTGARYGFFRLKRLKEMLR